MPARRTVVSCTALTVALTLALTGCSLWRTASPGQPASVSPSQTPAGQAAASSATATAASPAAASGAAAKKPPASAEPTKTHTSEAALPALTSSAKAAAIEIARKNSVGAGAIAAGEVRIARDSKGVWWASVAVTASNPSLDPAVVYLKRPGTRWLEVDFGTGITPPSDSRFPKDVAGQL